MATGGPGGGASLSELGSRLIDNAKAYARAEIDVAKQTGLAYVRASINGIILAVVALLLVLAALPVLIAALGMTLAIWVGPAAGLAIAGAIAVIVAGLLVWLAARSFGRIGGKVR